MRIPAFLLLSILVVNSLFFPGATDRLVSVGPLSITREGLTFGLISAGRILVAFLASVAVPVHDPGGRRARGADRPGRESPDRLRRPVRGPDGPAHAGPGGAILEAQQARGLSVTGSFVQRVRALVPLIGPVLLGSLVDVRERTFALEARGFGARPGRTAYRVVADPPIDRWLRLLIDRRLAVGSSVAVAVTGVCR